MTVTYTAVLLLIYNTGLNAGMRVTFGGSLEERRGQLANLAKYANVSLSSRLSKLTDMSVRFLGVRATLLILVTFVFENNSSCHLNSVE